MEKILYKINWYKLALWLIVAVFVITRLYYLAEGYIWYDDVATMGTVEDFNLNEILNYALNEITGPLFPTLILWGLKKIISPDLLLMHLPSLFVGLASFFVFYKYILKKLFKSKFVILASLSVMTFSMPLLFYTQTIQPSIYYFFTCAVLFAVFLNFFIGEKKLKLDLILWKKISLFGLLGALMFMFNYMSLVVFFTLLGVLLVLLIQRNWQFRNRKLFKLLLITVLVMALAALPVLELTVWRLQLGQTVVRTYFKTLYYVRSIFQVPALTYDILNYLFNFSYTPEWYRPMGNNVLTIPFVLITITGIIRAIRTYQKRWPVHLVIIGAILFVVISQIMPVGGIRHILTIAPFILLAFAYGLEYLERLLDKYNPLALSRIILKAALILFAPLVFINYGINFYSDHATRVDLQLVVDLAKKYDVPSVVEFEIYGPILYENMAAGNVFEKNGLKTYYFDRGICPDPTQKYLFVSHHSKIDSDWPFEIVPERLDCMKDFKTVVLHDDEGVLEVNTLMQSMYSPPNGFFIFLLHPKD